MLHFFKNSARIVLGILIAPLAFLCVNTSMAVEKNDSPYGSAGCGLGSMLFKTKTGLIQVFASFTNTSTGSQSFGISSGTSNCEPPHSTNTAAAFIETNRISLEKDVSRGSGETLVHFSKVMGCTNPGLLGSKLQPKFSEVFKKNAEAADVKRSVETLIQADHELRTDCSENAVLAVH